MSGQMIGTYLGFAAAMMGAGAVGGILAGLLGVGGGIIIVPVLFHLFGILDVDAAVRMHLAVGTSLATIVVTATSSTRAHWRRGAIDTALLRSWAAWIVSGAVIGMVLFRFVNSAVLTLVFATVALVVAGYMLWARNERHVSENLPVGPVRYVLGLVIGAVSSIMGIGGGTLTVPILSLFRYPIKNAVATAAAIGLLIAVPGTLGAIVSGLGVEDRPPFSVGYVNVLGFALLVPLTAALAPVGARIAHAVDSRYLRYAFALFLTITAVNMYASVW